MNRQWLAACGLAALLTGCANGPSDARVLNVGPAQQYNLPSQAAAVARQGDTIRIAPGEYTDCAVWRANRLTIEGIGNGAVIANKSCAGKAIFVIDGNDVTVRNLAFEHAEVADHNGAGIRAEGRNLIVEHSRFIDNENGILGNTVPGSTVRISDSEFRGNGKCQPQCAHGIYINAVDKLEVERSRFIDQHVGHHIKSRALNTVLVGNDISDGPNGNSSYLVDVPNGGNLLIQGNRFEKGPHSENDDTAIAIGFEKVTHPSTSLVVRGNSFTNDMQKPTAFVHNRTLTPAVLSGNHLQGDVTPLVGPGTVNP